MLAGTAVIAQAGIWIVGFLVLLFSVELTGTAAYNNNMGSGFQQ